MTAPPTAAARPRRSAGGSCRRCCSAPGAGQRLVERNVYVYRRTWMIIVSGFFEPVFYLVSIRLGLGALVGDVQVGGQTVSYAEFVAPALLATSAMNGALYDSTMNVFYKLKYARVYDAVLATPMGVGDVAVGEIGWALLRGAIYATGFLDRHGGDGPGRLGLGRRLPARPRC